MASSDPEERAVALEWLASDLARFKRDGNPLAAWEAIHACVKAGVSFPDELQRYLDGVAVNLGTLWRLEPTSPRFPRGNKIGDMVAKAVGLSAGRKRNLFAEMTSDTHDFTIAFEVYLAHGKMWNRARRGQGATHDWRSVYKDVAATHKAKCRRCRGKHWTTIEKIWRKHAMEIIPKHLIEKSKSRKIDDILR